MNSARPGGPFRIKCAKPGVVGQEIYGAGGPIWYAVWQDELTAEDGHRNK